MPRLRARLLDHERKRRMVIICPTSNYKCRACLKPLFGRCRKLEIYLETGEWIE